MAVSADGDSGMVLNPSPSLRVAATVLAALLAPLDEGAQAAAVDPERGWKVRLLSHPGKGGTA